MAIPMKDALLVPWASNFATRISAEGNPYGISTGQQTEMTARTAAFTDAYNALMDARADGTRSAAMTQAKDTSKESLLLLARELYGIISSNPSISDADKILAGVHVRATPSPVPAPVVSPGVDVMSVVARTVTVNIHDSASSTKRGKPSGCKSAFVYSYVGAEYPSDPALWNFEGATTKPKFQVVFDGSVPSGATVWITAAWANGKQELGPPSMPVTTNLPGGGSSTEAMKAAA
jgi:hypothetical protein